MTTTRSLPVMLAALALCGCSGGDDGPLTKAEYEERVRSVYAEVQEAFAATNVDPELLAERVEAAQAELREAADALEDTEAPEEVVAENAQIVVGMRAYAEDLDRLVNAAVRGDQQTIDDFNARLATSEPVEQIAEAAERMKFKGYDLGPIAEE